MHSAAKRKNVTPSQIRRQSRGSSAATLVKISDHITEKSQGGKDEAGTAPAPSKR